MYFIMEKRRIIVTQFQNSPRSAEIQESSHTKDGNDSNTQTEEYVTKKREDHTAPTHHNDLRRLRT